MDLLTPMALTLLPFLGSNSVDISTSATAPIKEAAPQHSRNTVISPESTETLLLAQTIVPTDHTTQTTVSDQGIIDITGGTQAASNLFHSFDQFDLAQPQTANFITTPSIDTVIGQVIGGNASTIDGQLKITGSQANLYLVNPAGLLFGPNARLDLNGSFTATTATHIGDGHQWFDVLSHPNYHTFVNPPSHFGFSGGGSIVNQGHLQVPIGENLRLLGDTVTNVGTLTAASGEITLLGAEAGQTLHIRQPGGLLSLEITSDRQETSLIPELLTGGNLEQQNQILVNEDGALFLTTAPTVSVTNAGDISTDGDLGGTITLLGNSIQISEGTLTASGNHGGGSIRIGGDYQGQGLLPRASQTVVSNTAHLMANATQRGDGGTIIVWADGVSAFDGYISAQSATGNGGLVETSGLKQLIIGDQAQVNTYAAQGEAGLWLLDPPDLTVVGTGGIAIIPVDSNDAVNSSINATTVVNALQNTDVKLQATNSITVDSAIDASGNTNTNNLFFDTTTLNLNERITLRSDGEISGTATTVNVGNNSSIQNAVDAVTSGGTVTLANTTYREGSSITIDHDLTLLGQGQNATYISGDANNNGVKDVGDHQVINITSNDLVTIQGLTIQDGAYGGGVKNNGDNVFIQDVTFTNNEIIYSSSMIGGGPLIINNSGNGGAINNSGSLTLNNTVFENNSAAFHGGAIANTATGKLSIVDSNFQNNSSIQQDGGAIYNRGRLSVSNTRFENNQSGDDGGAIDILQGSVDITDSNFINNQASDHGGAIDIDPNGTVTITNSHFELNSSNESGGAIFNEGILNTQTTNFAMNVTSNAGGGLFNQGNASINNTSFDYNQANDGGGLYNQASGLTNITAGYFLNNSAQSGGGIFNQGTVSLITSIVANNQATGLDSLNGGGGIHNAFGGDITVDSSLISNNTSATSGGGLFNVADDNQTLVAISNSAIVGNQAAALGGGIEIASINGYSHLSKLQIINSTISNNQAVTGGGIRTVGPTTLINATIVDNISNSSGGGISENLTTAENPNLINTIVARNSAPINPDVEGQFIDQGHNLIGITQGSSGFNTSTLVGSTNSPIDPKLTPLNNYDSSLPSHQLESDSPAANAGDNTAATSIDQSGNTRVISEIVDIGAIESNIISTITTEPSVVIASNQQPSQGTANLSLLSLNPEIFDRIHPQDQGSTPFNQDIQASTNSLSNRQVRYFDEEAFQYIEASFSKEYEHYWHLPQTSPISLSSVQEILQQANTNYQTQSAVIYALFIPSAQSNSNAVDRFVLPHRNDNSPSPDDQLLLILIPAVGDPIQQIVNVTRRELAQQTKLFRLATSDPDDDISYRALARQMYSWLLGPLQQDLANHNISHIMYSLDQGLRTIPIAAMMQGDTFAIEQYGVSVIPSIGLTHLQIGSRGTNRRTLIAGASQFTNMAALKAVPIELDMVAQNTQATNVLLNEEFTLSNFLAFQASQQPELLHLATHAEFNSGDPDQSFLQFWDNQLTLKQMKEISWPELEMFILSACSTALSSPEAELGFTGLAAAAGIETSIGSLWNVSDLGTLALMTELYTQLAQFPLRFQALRTAQLSLIRGSTHINNNVLSASQSNIPLPIEWDLPEEENFSHPFYWAGFTMVGNPWD